MSKEECNAVDKHLDIDGIVDGIINNDERGSMFFSILNQSYSKDIASMLCGVIRAYSERKGLHDIMLTTNANNMKDLVVRVCNKILVIIDKQLNQVHNDIVRDLNKYRGDENNDHQ